MNWWFQFRIWYAKKKKLLFEIQSFLVWPSGSHTPEAECGNWLISSPLRLAFPAPRLWAGSEAYWVQPTLEKEIGKKKKCWIHTSFRVLGLPEGSRCSGPSGQTTSKAFQLAVGSGWVAWNARKQKFKSSDYLIFKETLKQVFWLTHLTNLTVRLWV